MISPSFPGKYAPVEKPRPRSGASPVPRGEPVTARETVTIKLNASEFRCVRGASVSVGAPLSCNLCQCVGSHHHGPLKLSATVRAAMSRNDHTCSPCCRCLFLHQHGQPKCRTRAASLGSTHRCQILAALRIQPRRCCPFRKSYPDVLVVQSSQDGNGGNGARSLDRSMQRRIFP